MRTVDELSISVHDTILQVREWHDLTDKCRAGLCSALMSVARLANMPPACLTLTPAGLRQPALNRSAASFGIKRGSLYNMQSRIRYVMRRLGIIEPADTPLTEPWQTLINRLIPPTIIAPQKAALKNLARFCSIEGIAPEGVCAATFEAYEVHLTTRTMTTHERKQMNSARRAWNTAARVMTSWPTASVPSLPKPHAYILPPKAFTPAFQRSLEHFRQHLAADLLNDPFDMFAPESPDGAGFLHPAPPPRPLKPRSVALRVDHARWAASALVASGVPIESINDLTDLVKPLGRCRDILRYIHTHAGKNRSSAGTHIGGVLSMIARHHVRLDAADLAQIRKWRAVVSLSYTGMTEKNGRTVRAAMAPGHELALLALPAKLMAEARRLLPDKPRPAAGVALRAMAIAILNSLALRLENLCNLRIDQHLRRSDPRRGLITAIHIPGEETKNGRSITAPVPRATGRLLDEWIKHYRPHLATPGSPYLFPGQGTASKPITHQAMRDAIKRATGDHVGVVLSPHQFRHVAANRLLTEYPRAFETVSQLLGHASSATAIRHYSGTDQEAAARQFDELNTRRAMNLLRKSRSKPRRRKPARPTGTPPATSRSMPAGLTRESLVRRDITPPEEK